MGWAGWTGNWPPPFGSKFWPMGEGWAKFMGDIWGAWGFCAGEAVCMRCGGIWPGRKCEFCMVGEGV